MVSLNSKFRCFLVRILIRKDNTDNKVFKKEFYTKGERRGIEKIKCCKFSTICWKLSGRVSRKQSYLNLRFLAGSFVVGSKEECNVCVCLR